jgi:hypothetical protein
MRGAILSLPYYAFIALCSVKKNSTGTNLPLPQPYYIVMALCLGTRTNLPLPFILLGLLNQGGYGGRDMWHSWGRGEVFTGFWLGGPNVRGHWWDPGVGYQLLLPEVKATGT